MSSQNHDLGEVTFLRALISFPGDGSLLPHGKYGETGQVPPKVEAVEVGRPLVWLLWVHGQYKHIRYDPCPMLSHSGTQLYLPQSWVRPKSSIISFVTFGSSALPSASWSQGVGPSPLLWLQGYRHSVPPPPGLAELGRRGTKGEVCNIGMEPAASPFPLLTPGHAGDKATQLGNWRPRDGGG